MTPEQQLHDRATRGAILSAQEQQQLEDWYMQQDQKEFEELIHSDDPAQSVSALLEANTSLQVQVDTLLDQLNVTTATVKSLSEQNKILRDEVTRLKREFAQQTSVPSV
jgi:chaperonin cofactor prefoldin